LKGDRQMFDWIVDRWRFIAELLRQRVYGVYGRILAPLSVLYTLFSVWRDELATPSQQETLRAVTFLPHWPVTWWIAICLAMRPHINFSDLG